MVVWDTEQHTPIKLFGSLVDPGSDVIWEPSAMTVNNLNPEICSKFGMSDEKACKYVMSWYGSCDVACAHNGNVFDRLILIKWAEQYGLDPQKDKIWIDTKADLTIKQGNATRLTYMAADNGFLNPFPHRAMFDVMTMFKILDKYDINEVLEMSKSPTLRVRSLQPFEQNNLARNRGFHPEYDVLPDGGRGKFKYWSMSIKECKLDAERVACRSMGFEIEVIK